MKNTFVSFFCVSLLLSTLSVNAQLYWDKDGATPGAGGPTPTGTWGTDAYWSTSANGDVATGAWIDNSTAVFAAGTDAIGAYTVNVSGAQNAGGITFEEGTVNLSTGTISFPGGGTIQVDATSATINSVITGGSGSLNKLGTGILVLGGNNTFSNKLSIAQGTLRMGAAGDILSAAEIDVSSAATLDLNGNSVGIGSLGAGGLSTFATVSLGSGTLTNLGVGPSTRYEGAITGSGGLTMTGTNTLTLWGTNVSALSTFTGKTVILDGTLSIHGDGSLGTPPGAYVADQITILNSATLNLARTQVDLNANRGIYVGTPGGVLSISSGQSPSINSIISGPGTLVKANSGNVNLNGANSFGGYTITGGGTRFNNDTAAGSGTITISPVSSVFLRNLTPPGNVTTLANPITVNSSAQIVDMNAASPDIFILNGPISGAGVLMRGQQAGSSGIVALGGDNSGWSGGLVFQRGKLALGHKNALGTTALTVQPASNASAVNTATLMAWTVLTGVNAVTTPMNILITNNLFNLTIGGTNALEFSSSIYLGDTTNSTPIITVTNTGGTTFSGVVSGGAGIGLTKDGVDTLTLSGGNTYSGVTTISNGTLLVNAPGSLAGGGVVVHSGGALGGSGTINGLVTVNSGGVVGAGSSAGTLTLAAGLNLSAGGTNLWELVANSASSPGVNFDQIVVSGGSLVLGGSSTLQVSFGPSINFSDPFWSANHSWKIINGSNPGSTTFVSLVGTNGITAGSFAVSADSTGAYLNFTTASTSPAATPARITSIPGAGTTSVTVNYTNTLAGTNYVLSYNTNLATTNWYTSGTKAAVGTTDFQIDSPPAGSPRRYYRVYYK